MKKILLFALVVIAAGAAMLSCGAESAISVAIAVPLSGGERFIDYHPYGQREPHFHVIIANNSDNDQRIWGEGNSWGYDALSFVIMDNSGRTWTVKRKPINAWQQNAPTFWTLKAHDSLVLDIYFSDTNKWVGFPSGHNLTKSVTMHAIFEVKPDRESQKKDVWTGHIISKTDRYVFYDSTF